jgi:ATP-dependent DNA helicase RecQ
MLALCETAGCRRAQMLAYFGEEAPACGNCDTCTAPPQVWDGTVAAQKFLSAVYRLAKERGQKFGAGHVIDILTGKATPKVAENGHERLSVFGVGTDLREPEWRGVARQLLAQGLLGVEGDFGVLTLTTASAAVLRKEREIMLRREPERVRPPRASRPARGGAAGGAGAPGGAGGADLTPEATKVFERLREWRAGTAREQNVPAYVIFHDATLRQIATEKPATLTGLSGINGVGEAKLAKYGQQVLEVLSA